MNATRTTISLVLLAALGTAAQAQSSMTREQVQAELADAIRTGDVVAPGDSGMKLNELYPQRYPHAAATAATSRAQVRAELTQAIRTGDIASVGDGTKKLNEEFPQRYAKARVTSRHEQRVSIASDATSVAR